MQRILIIDDDVVVRQMLREILEIHGYACRDVEGGEQALQAIYTEHFHLIISDHEMPRMTGLQLLQRLEPRTKNHIPPVVFMTGNLSESLRKSAQKAGADAFLTKPFTNTELLSLVNQVIDRQEHADSPLVKTTHPQLMD